MATQGTVRLKLRSPTPHSPLSTQYSVLTGTTHHSPLTGTTQNSPLRTEPTTQSLTTHPRQGPDHLASEAVTRSTSRHVLQLPPARSGQPQASRPHACMSDSDVRVGTHTDTSTSTGLDTGSDCAHGQPRHASSLWPLASDGLVASRPWLDADAVHYAWSSLSQHRYLREAWWTVR